MIECYLFMLLILISLGISLWLDCPVYQIFYKSKSKYLAKSKLGRVYNRVSDGPDSRDLMFKPTLPNDVLPVTVDLRPLCPPIYDQGQTGSCTGNAAAGAFDFLQLAELKSKVTGSEEFDSSKYEPASRLFIYYNERVMNQDTGEDAGATLRDAVKSLLYFGACPESVWPYDEKKALSLPSHEAYASAKLHKISKYYRFADLIHVKHSLAAGFPVIFGITIFESFESDTVARTGMVPMPSAQEQCLGGHAVMIVGYDDEKQHVIVRNSWGISWGDEGYFYLPYEYINNSSLAEDFWSVRK
jgi:C1A family cysteine protease